MLVPVIEGNALVLAPPLGCRCCKRYSCRPGGIPCQECVRDNAGPYTSLEECEPECPSLTCVYCVEEAAEGPCGDTYITYACTNTSCDSNGDCIPPAGTVVAGPSVTSTPTSDPCICPDPPDPPPTPECCDTSDCGCCEQCVDGTCVGGCPAGTVCLNCECVPPEQYYYCCRETSACTGSCQWEALQADPNSSQLTWILNVPCSDGCTCLPPPDPPYSMGEVYTSSCSGGGGSATNCQLGPCEAPLEYVSGPHSSLPDCCASCGCKYDCAIPGYYCFPDPVGGYESLEECQASCQPPSSLGTCCYTIAPNSEDNTYDNPPFPAGCALVKGCFGVMSFFDCEALKTATGTNTTWYADYSDCSFCPVTQSRPCCYPDPADPCVLLCSETDEACCDDLGGTLYTALADCDDTWPSGKSACRPTDCSWPPGQTDALVLENGCSCSRLQEYTAPPPTGACNNSPVQWQPGYPASLGNCNWTWVHDQSRCGGGANGADHVCDRYRILRIDNNGDVVDATADAVVNTDDLSCCSCTINYGNQPCVGDECLPLPYFADPVPQCLP